MHSTLTTLLASLCYSVLPCAVISQLLEEMLILCWKDNINIELRPTGGCHPFYNFLAIEQQRYSPVSDCFAMKEKNDSVIRAAFCFPSVSLSSNTDCTYTARSSGKNVSPTFLLTTQTA
jgi:hypothetical protein